MNVAVRTISAALLLAATVCFGVVMRPLSVEELSSKADFVIQGIVTNKVCLKDEAGRIYTRVEVQVSETIKGKNVGDTISVVHGGGTVGDQTTEVSGQVEYEIGKEVVAFITVNPKGMAVTIGLCQGKFSVWRDANTGEAFVYNPFHGSPPASTNTAALQSAATGSATQRLALTELKQQVQQSNP